MHLIIIIICTWHCCYSNLVSYYKSQIFGHWYRSLFGNISIIVGFRGVKWGAASGKEIVELFVCSSNQQFNTVRATHWISHCVLSVVWRVLLVGRRFSGILNDWFLYIFWNSWIRRRCIRRKKRSHFRLGNSEMNSIRKIIWYGSSSQQNMPQ